jgi:hypothetical protein
MYTAIRQMIMPMRALIHPTLLICAAASVAIQTAQAQPCCNPTISTWTAGGDGSGTSNWNTGTNWSTGIVPNVALEDSATINGGGTAQINSAIPTNAGSVVLGQGLAADEPGGTLEIQSGGSLTVVGDPMFAADGSVRVGQNAGQGAIDASDTANPNDGTGTLRVLPGGTLTSDSLTLGGTVDSSITLGGAAAGTATLNTGSVTLGRTMRVIGPNVSFNSSGAGAGITFQGTSVLIPEITDTNHSVLKTSGAALLGGTLQADFTGVVPAGNQSWDIVDAASVAGSFASVLPDPDTPLGTAQILNTRTVDGGNNGKLVQMFVQQLPMLTVNRDTGTVAITNPGTTSVPLDSYTVRSDSGSLSLADWQSLEANPGVAGAGWSESNASANRVSELRSSGSSDLVDSGSWSLGDIYQPSWTEFGEDTEDIVLQFNDPVTQQTLDGIVSYTGTAINNLVLFVDPTTGNVKIRNTSPFTVQIDGYTISSDTNSLNSDPAQWNSLQDQPGEAGANWSESNLSDGRVSEVQSAGTTTLTGNSTTTFDLGGLFKTGGTQDLSFEFLLAGESGPNTGVVVYEGTVIDGDYDDSGQVAQGDLDLVLLNWGKTVPPDPVPAGWINQQPSGLIGQGALDGVLLNWGNTAGSGAALGVASNVPEPATFFMLVAAVMGWGLIRRNVNAA